MSTDDPRDAGATRPGVLSLQDAIARITERLERLKEDPEALEGGEGEDDGGGGETVITGGRRRLRRKLDPRLSAVVSMSKERLLLYREMQQRTVEEHRERYAASATDSASGSEASSERGATAESEASNGSGASNERSEEPMDEAYEEPMDEAYEDESSGAEFADMEAFAREVNRDVEVLEESTEPRRAAVTERAEEAAEEPDDAEAFQGQLDASTVSGGEGPRAQLSPFLHGFTGLDDVDDPRRAPLRVFIRYDGDPRELERHGVEVRRAVAGLCTASITLAMLKDLEADPKVIYVELSRPLQLSLDETRYRVGAEALQSATCAASDPGVVLCPVTASGDEDCAITGDGVLIGVIDGGLDFRHPDFWDVEADALRVDGIWHMGASSDPAFSPPPGFSYGRLYTQTMLSDDIYSGAPGSMVPYLPPEESHGTHVAGIAAGAGNLDPARRGVAPRARVVFADMVNSGVLALGDMTELMDAVGYIFDHAGATPCVINLSLNDNIGPHDGTSYAEQFIDQLLATPGRAMVVAAGNANTQGKHTQGVVSGVTDLTFEVPTLFNGLSESMELWYDGQDRFDVAVVAPDGSSYGAPADSAHSVVGFGGLGELVVDHRTEDPRNGDNVISVILLPAAGGALPAGTWTLRLRPQAGDPARVLDGRFHAWIDRNTNTSAGAGVAWTSPVDDALTVQVPGTAQRVITVGNHAKTTSGALHETSGRGPTRDGRYKPEIAAPGVNVNACRSMDWTATGVDDPMNQLSNPPAWYTQKSGTSMAAPHVTGAVALLFEGRDPNLSAVDARYILQSTADVTGVSVPDTGFGWGRLKVDNATCWVVQGPDVWARTGPTDTGVEPYTGPAAHRSPDVWVRNSDDDGLVHQNPAFGQVNYVYGVVRNRGTGPATNTRVRLYWADPSTNIPVSAWRSDGITVDGLETNQQIVPQLDPGAELPLPVAFGWSPPPVGSSIAGDNHFCLLMVLDNDNDPVDMSVGGWGLVRERNNVALKNVHVVELPPAATSASATFIVVGGDGDDSLDLDLSQLPAGAGASLTLPIGALDLGAMLPKALQKAIGGALGEPRRLAKVLDGVRLSPIDLRGVRGVGALEFKGKLAVFELPRERAWLGGIALASREVSKAVLRVDKLSMKAGDSVFIDIEHSLGGRSVGGLSVELRLKPARGAPGLGSVPGALTPTSPRVGGVSRGERAPSDLRAPRER